MTGENNDLRQIQVAIVLPFLNEQESLAITCNSLGFGLDENNTPTNSTLFLIDNASTDDSLGVANTIKEKSREGRVIIGHESERGYIPPRHRGNILAREYAKLHDLNERNILILQADADTVYDKGYSELIRQTAQNFEWGILFQASVSYPPEFGSSYPEYISLCQEIDSELEILFAPESYDVLIDDKVSGYLLKDYFNWCSHQREYNKQGEEIHAETSRLFIKSKAYGATKLRVEEAYAVPSQRRLLNEPALNFASAGFPRESSWNEKWRKAYQGPTTLSEFCSNSSHCEVQRAIRVRQQHLIGLLGILPLHIALTLGNTVNYQLIKIYRNIMSLLPKRTVLDLRIAPGRFLTDIFEIVDYHGDDLLKLLLNKIV